MLLRGRRLANPQQLHPKRRDEGRLATQLRVCRLRATGTGRGKGGRKGPGRRRRGAERGSGQRAKKTPKPSPGIHRKLSEETEFEGEFPNVFQTISEGFHAVGGAQCCLLHGRHGDSPLLPSHTRKTKLRKRFEPAETKRHLKTISKVCVSNKSVIDLRQHLKPTLAPAPPKPVVPRQEETQGGKKTPKPKGVNQRHKEPCIVTLALRPRRLQPPHPERSVTHGGKPRSPEDTIAHLPCQPAPCGRARACFPGDFR